ncbi:MAG: AGE family epimerase/isomerase [Bacteroides sp.]|nr:AGE family epimerase/isomerase [Eubacterium sp.]MCM1417460.1 AGE family epimerase/isomerase [Roseburia sp.]MCM1461640.1 AGE family epimerase/isomerase [Bacteroides sp.]
MLTREVKKELTEHILPFWDRLEDKEYGGFYGYMSHDLALDKNAEKGVILHSRILWFYSNCYLVLKDGECLKKAKGCYDFMVKNCVDHEYGGVYWSVNADGSPKDTMKHTYCQAFFIYALASYYDASRDEGALKLALEMFETVERRCTDEVAYLEAMSRTWETVENDALSENGLMADKTMNTTLHLLEAYTELYRVSGDGRVADRLKFQLRLFLDKIYLKEDARLLVFFDKNLDVIGDIHSYGHDIEATWLLDRACEVLGDEKMTEEVSAMNRKIVAHIARIAYKDGSLLNERDKTEINTWRIWWVQAEGVVGFLNAYQKYENAEYLEIAKNIWEYIKKSVIDKREGGEWFSEVSEDGVPAKHKPTVDPWKCPYHNGRMCLEVIKRS